MIKEGNLYKNRPHTIKVVGISHRSSYTTVHYKYPIRNLTMNNHSRPLNIFLYAFILQ